MEFRQLDTNNQEPLYSQIARIIETEVTGKKISVGQKLPTEQELGRIFNVGRKTVREAMSQLVNDGYLSRRPNLGTFVISTEPRKGRTLELKNEISFVVCPYNSDKTGYTKHYPQAYLERIMKGIEEKARENGAYLMYSIVEDGRLSIAGKEKDIAGLILAGDLTQEVFGAVKKSRIPFVCIGDVRKGNGVEKDVDVIAVDDFAGTYLATKHLLELGHRKILFTYYALDYPWQKEEMRGYREALREAGIENDKNLEIWIEDKGVNSGYTAVRKALEQKLEFTGVISITDSLNMGILKALNEKNLSVPEDISVVSIGVLSESITVTSAVYDREEMGRKAAERIIERINNPDLGYERIVLPFKMHMLDSTMKYSD
jgi:GntR family transcriptional regulator, arabinose operon transcriptional repressor